MLRHNDSIRLTATERATYAGLTAAAPGPRAAPTSVQDHDRWLDAASQAWSAGDSAEEKLLSALALDFKIEGVGLFVLRQTKGRGPGAGGAEVRRCGGV